jgi:hypothetical protein
VFTKWTAGQPYSSVRLANFPQEAGRVPEKLLFHSVLHICNVAMKFLSMHQDSAAMFGARKSVQALTQLDTRAGQNVGSYGGSVHFGIDNVKVV